MRCPSLFVLLVILNPAQAFGSLSPLIGKQKSLPAWSPLLKMPSTTIPTPSYFSSSTTALMASPTSMISSAAKPALAAVLALRGGGDNDELVALAYDWCVNLGAPAALVAGAVVATMYENIRGEELVVKASDTRYAKVCKKLTSILLMSAFALQIISIFVTTVTGTMLLTRGIPESATATTALGLLKEHFEFEYLTSRLSFLQGLLNWLAAVAVEHTIPRESEGRGTLKMNQFVASCLTTLILLLVSFYNAHMTFYKNYFHMLSRYLVVFTKRYFLAWPPRPLAFLFIPSIFATIGLAIRAIRDETDDFDPVGKTAQ